MIYVSTASSTNDLSLRVFTVRSHRSGSPLPIHHAESLDRQMDRLQLFGLGRHSHELCRCEELRVSLIVPHVSVPECGRSGLAAARFILGLFESIIFAGFGVIISAWWKKEEQPWRTAVIFSTLSSVVNGLLSFAASKYNGPLAQWQVLFLSVGAITFAWAILCWFFLAGSPLEAVWLTKREKVIAIQRTAGNMTGVENKVIKTDQILEAFKDPKSWLIFLINSELCCPYRPSDTDGGKNLVCLNIPNNGTNSRQVLCAY